MSAVNTANMLVFYDPTRVPNPITSKMINYDRDLPLSPDQAWKKPFIMDPNPILAARIQAALVNGPFVAEAKLGPKFYDTEPNQLMEQIPTHPALPVYGWTPAQRKPQQDDGAYQAIIVCGIQKNGDAEHIYYVLAKELYTNWPEAIAAHQKTSNKVYVASLRRFSADLYNMYPPAQNVEIEQGARAADARADQLGSNIDALIREVTQRMNDLTHS